MEGSYGPLLDAHSSLSTTNRVQSLQYMHARECMASRGYIIELEHCIKLGGSMALH